MKQKSTNQTETLKSNDAVSGSAEMGKAAAKGKKYLKKKVAKAKPKKPKYAGLLSRKLKSAWIKELKAERYARTNGALYRDGEVCALGVLRAIQLNLEPSELQNLSFENMVQMEQYPLESMEGAQGSIIRMNDQQKKTWAEIADWVKKNF